MISTTVPNPCFASDNSAGIHPDVLAAIAKANRGPALAYGNDGWTEAAIKALREVFEPDTEAAFVFNGTAANVLGLSSVTASHQAIICAETAHLNVDECAAPEKYIGCKLIAIPAPGGKLTPELVKPHLRGFGVSHHAQPRIISITQSTECGTVYQPEEIEALANLAHRHDMLLHMDGARLWNAAASLDTDLKALTVDTGVDVLSLGGTKNGLLAGEAVVFLRPDLAAHFPYIRKQGMQLGSKMRFIAAQFLALLNNDLGYENARHANAMATLLAEKLAAVPGVSICHPVEANAVFARLPEAAIDELQKAYRFLVWNPPNEVRLMTAFDTAEAEIARFAELAESACRQRV